MAAAACGSASTVSRRSSTPAGSPVSGGLAGGLGESVGGVAGGVPPDRLGGVAGELVGACGPVRRPSGFDGDGTAPEGVLPDARGAVGGAPGVRAGQEGRGGGSAPGPSSGGGRCFELGVTLVSPPPTIFGSSVCGLTGPPIRLMPIMIE
ncbi:phage tail tape measure protein [Actinomadura madurae]|uniref:phage tail tape measure protein n=1 Tax=Actinomadura madurae TaxID=1993 RepID=UPI0015A5FB4E|nr:phage tail tape measure protein [Actinomadura madurae]